MCCTGEYLSNVLVPPLPADPAGSRFLLLFISTPESRGHWELCAGMVDLHCLQWQQDQEEEEEGVPAMDGCVSGGPHALPSIV